MSTDADKPFVIALEEHYWDADLVTMIFSHEDNRASDVEKCLLDVGELRLREMDEAGIDVQVLSHGAPGTHRMDADLAVRITRQTLFLQYKTEKAYTEKVSPRSRPDCERIMQMICDTVGKSGRRIGERQIREVTPRAADKVYEKIINGRTGSDCGRARRWSGSAARFGASCAGCTRSYSTRSIRTRGTTSRSRAAPRARSTLSPARRSLNSPGAALRKAGPSRQRWR